MQLVHDIIIVGAGLSGLYSAYNIRKNFPHINLLVLEKNDRSRIGGRIGNDNFYGSNIVVGAGIGRTATDHLLFQLLDDLDIHYSSFQIKMNYTFQPIDIMKCMTFLKSQYRKYKYHPSVTFKQFAKAHLGNSTYNKFIISSGFSDYEEEDIYEVLYHYQMSNNVDGWSAIGLDWNKLIHKLCNKIGYSHIKTSTAVTKLNHVLDQQGCYNYHIRTDQDVQFYCKKVIIATPISATQKILPSFPIYKQIHGQPFLLVYAKFNKKSAQIMATKVPYFTIVSGPLQKILPMDKEKGVYMIAYTDNKYAEFLKYKVDSIPKNKIFFENELEKALYLPSETLKIIALTSYYWPIGTHYYSPLNTKQHPSRQKFIFEAQHPEPGILVVGEAVSRKQGWTEGALESVHAVLNDKWIKSTICDN